MRKTEKLIIILALLTLSISATAQDIPNNEIWYTASEKLVETTEYYSGLHLNEFNTAISSHTFSNGKGVIKFNGDVTYIGHIYNTSVKYRHYGDYGAIPPNPPRIMQGAFQGCENMTTITIPNSVTMIGSDAFSGCSSLTGITIPNSVTSIENSAFNGCHFTRTELINHSSLDETSSSYWGAVICDIIQNDGLCIKDNVAISYRGKPTSINIPTSVTSIESWAFRDCSSLSSVTIGNSVTSIGRSAFGDCTGLTSITIPNSVTSIGEDAFNGCTGLTSVTIGNSVTSIESGAFRDCSSLSSITIPYSVTSIGGDAFEGCTSLPVENNVKYADTYLVGAVDRTLPTYTIKEGTKWIGGDAFYGCSSLTSVTIPNSVTSIEYWAFDGCTGLTSITIPYSVASIGYRAFGGCSSLKSVYVQWKDADKIPAIDSNTFPYSTCDLYVPDGTMSIYQDKEYWNSFRNMPVRIPNNEIWYTASSKLKEVTSRADAGLHTNAFNTTIKSHTFSNGKGVIKFESDVTSIGERAFCKMIIRNQPTCFCCRYDAQNPMCRRRKLS